MKLVNPIMLTSMVSRPCLQGLNIPKTRSCIAAECGSITKPSVVWVAPHGVPQHGGAARRLSANICINSLACFNDGIFPKSMIVSKPTFLTYRMQLRMPPLAPHDRAMLPAC